MIYWSWPTWSDLSVWRVQRLSPATYYARGAPFIAVSKAPLAFEGFHTNSKSKTDFQRNESAPPPPADPRIYFNLLNKNDIPTSLLLGLYIRSPLGSSERGNSRKQARPIRRLIGGWYRLPSETPRKKPHGKGATHRYQYRNRGYRYWERFRYDSDISKHYRDRYYFDSYYQYRDHAGITLDTIPMNSK